MTQIKSNKPDKQNVIIDDTGKKRGVTFQNETVSDFAKRYNLNVKDVMDWNGIVDDNYVFSEGANPLIEDWFETLSAATVIAHQDTPLIKPRLKTVTSSKPIELASSALTDFNKNAWGEEFKKPSFAKGDNTFGGVYALALKRIGGSIDKLEIGGEVSETPEIFQYIKGYKPKYEKRQFNEIVEPENTESDQKSQDLTNEQFNQLDVKDRAEYISNFLQNNGLEDWEALGFVAVMYNESALKPTAENQMEKKKWTGDESYKYGRGLCQWSLGRNDSFRDFYMQNHGNMVWANEASVKDQLDFALYERSNREALKQRIEEISQMINAGKISKEQAAILAADAYRRGFENGSSKSLASSKQMDAYEKVGSPNASTIYKKDARAVKLFLNA